MASIVKEPRFGYFYVKFRYGGRQYKWSLKHADDVLANETLAKVERMLRDLQEGHLTLPDGADVIEFMKSGGKRANALEAPKKVLTLAGLFERYEQEMPPGSMEENTLYTHKIHRKHLLGILGTGKPVPGLTTADVQSYVNKRAKQTFRGRPIGARTIQKEVATLRAVWNWGVAQGLINATAPTKGLRYDKREERPPFMTWGEIEQRVARGGLSDEEADSLWDSLFLDLDQVAELLVHVGGRNDLPPFVYPMFVFVAHTGARRSEMLRAQVDDVAGQVRLREKKKDRSVRFTFRHVPTSPLLARVMADWLAAHPGGQHVFTLDGGAPLTKDMATHYFGRALADSRWARVRGFHVFRHSFASNLARKGVDQREIDEYLGHSTDDMRRRYRHLFPEQRETAIKKLFG